MNSLSRCFVLAAILLSLAALPLAADQFTFHLGVPNAELSSVTGPFADVTINRTDSTHATVTLDALPGFTFGGNDLFALNLANTHVTVGGLAWIGGNANTSISGGLCSKACNVDGFDDFDLIFKGFDGFNSSIDTLSFNLHLTLGHWNAATDILADNADGYFAAGHAFVGPSGTLTGYVANGNPSNNVPEPGSLALLGFGLAALGWRRLR